MFCKKCGTEMKEGTCPKCGWSPEVKKPATPAAEPPKPAAEQAPAPKKEPGAVGKYFKRLWAQMLDLIKHPMKLLPTFVLTAIWIGLSMLSGLKPTANVPGVSWLYAIFYSNAGMYGGFFGAIGGIFGKAVFAAIINGFVLSLFAKKNPFKGMKKGFAKIFGSGLGAIAPFVLAGGFGLLLYWFFNMTSSSVNCMVAVVGAVAAIQAAGKQGGFLFSGLFSLLGKLSKGKTPSLVTVSRALTGFSAGMTLGFAFTFINSGLLLFLLGFCLVIAGFVLVYLGTNAKKQTAAMACLIIMAGLMLMPLAATPVLAADTDYNPYDYHGKIIYEDGVYNKYGQPKPILMDYNQDGYIDLLDQIIMRAIWHNPNYMDQPQSDAGVVAVSLTTGLAGAAGGVAASAAGVIVGEGAGEAALSGLQGLEGGDSGEDKADTDELDQLPENYKQLYNQYVSQDEAGDLTIRDPATGQEMTYQDNGDGTYTNILTGSTASKSDIADWLDTRNENADLFRQDAEVAKKAIEEQRAANQEVSQAQAEYNRLKAELEEQFKHEEYVDKMKEKYGTDDINAIKKEILTERQEADIALGEAQAEEAILNEKIEYAQKVEKASDVAIDVMAEYGGEEAKLVKDAYIAAKNVGRATSEVYNGQASASEAYGKAAINITADIAQNHADGVTQKAAANIFGEAAKSGGGAALEGKSMDQIKEATKQGVKTGSVNTLVDVATDFIPGAEGPAKAAGEGAKALINDLGKDLANNTYDKITEVKDD